ncbi:hypothetical protein [Streptomyces sp. VRA16 Mangrove soil]|uniref:hypothetical protein n=1 Tax=Streptomyces sp. VRA16 Mangrove soil TaxID=2817434 RepID=UPI001A9DE494|nr:hypothetical protein [Streptomyces sp. VRA16 Mangrove soil]MBO1333714.1 hypothetical protein [Streptomyces sp. VRA16 Mangrove soil]
MTDHRGTPGARDGADELALLRAANPVRADDPRYADARPLHHTAERALNQLLHRGRRRARRALVLRAEAVACALAALLALGLSNLAATPATATPPKSCGATAPDRDC